MSYEPTVWVAGDVVTATKMNKIEQGISGSGSNGLVVNMEEDNGAYILDERFSTIADCIENGGVVYIHGTTTVEGGTETEIDFYVPVLMLVDSESGVYTIVIYVYSVGDYNFVAATREDYPIDSDSNGNDSQPEGVA